jgi:hypothetical protein
MTPDQWEECYSVKEPLEELAGRGRISDRKLRLFGCACIRGVVRLITDSSSRDAIGLAESFADGRTTAEELSTAHDAFAKSFESAWQSDTSMREYPYFTTREHALLCDALGLAEEITRHDFDTVSARDLVDCVAGLVMHSAVTQNEWGTSAGDAAAERAFEQWRPGPFSLLRDVFGGLLRPVVFDDAWLTKNGRVALKLAQAIYEDRAFDRMPELAAALKDAGCENQEVLGHCTRTEPHVRGCWVVDLLLGKG